METKHPTARGGPRRKLTIGALGVAALIGFSAGAQRYTYLQ